MTRGKITKYKDTISSPTEISLVQECQHKLHHLSVWEKKKNKKKKKKTKQVSHSLQTRI